MVFIFSVIHCHILGAGIAVISIVTYCCQVHSGEHNKEFSYAVALYKGILESRIDAEIQKNKNDKKVVEILTNFKTNIL